MKRWLPHPWMASVLVVAWLLLAGRMTPGTLLVGVLLAVALARLFDRLEPPPVRVRRIGLLAVLAARVIGDIIRSNLAVAWIITLRRRRANSGFVTIPLALEHRYALALLACIITATPGTIWVSHDATRRLLVIHVLDLDDESVWIASIKRRYEAPLLEIFR